MTHVRKGRWTSTGIAVAAVVGLSAGAGIGQQQVDPASGRQLTQEAALPGIDRGLRDQDPPRAPRERGASIMRADRSDSGTAAYLAGSLIVKYRAAQDFSVVDIPMTTDAESAAAVLRARADVEYAQPRYVNHAMVRPNDPLYANQWSLSLLDMERTWDIQPGATSTIVVAVLDSGMAFRSGTVRYTSRFSFRLTPGGPVYPALGPVDVPFAAAPDLGATGSSRFAAPRDFIWDDDLPFDLDGHGTHVTGTIGQITNNGVGTAGMAYNVRVMPVKVIQGLWDEIFGSPQTGTDDVVARGIRYAADNGAQVINMSIGRTTGGAAPAVIEALKYAVAKGVFVAVAAGNTGGSGNAHNRLAELAPSLDGMVAVGSVGRSEQLAYYSTTGPAVELVAPGGDQRRDGTAGGVVQQTLDSDLLDTYDRPVSQYTAPRADAFTYSYFQGTSMATPHVSGLAALLMQQGIKKPAAIEAVMKANAKDLGPTGRDEQYGWGLINPRATLRGLGVAK